MSHTLYADKKLPLEGRGLGHVTHFKILGPPV